MLKQTLLSLALMGTCTVAMAADYTYVAGGLQYGSISNNERFDKEFNQSQSSHIGNRDMDGIYFNGGYGFDNDLLIDGRISSIANNDRGLAEAVLGLGYHFAFSPNIDFYTLVGGSRHAMVFDASKDGKKPILTIAPQAKLVSKVSYHRISVWMLPTVWQTMIVVHTTKHV